MNIFWSLQKLVNLIVPFNELSDLSESNNSIFSIFNFKFHVHKHQSHALKLKRIIVRNKTRKLIIFYILRLTYRRQFRLKISLILYHFDLFSIKNLSTETNDPIIINMLLFKLLRILR